MSFAHVSRVHTSTGAITTASLAILIPSINVQEYDRFAVLYRNLASEAFTNLVVEGSLDGAESATSAPTWVQIPTASLPQPSALGLSAAVLTSALENPYKYIRVLGQASSTAAGGALTLTIGGHRRF